MNKEIKKVHLEVYDKLVTYLETMTLINACIKCSVIYNLSYRTIENYYYLVKKSLKAQQKNQAINTEIESVNQKDIEIVAQTTTTKEIKETINYHEEPKEFKKHWQDVLIKETGQYERKYIWNFTNTCLYNMVNKLIDEGLTINSAFLSLNQKTKVPLNTIKTKYKKESEEREFFEIIAKKRNLKKIENNNQDNVLIEQLSKMTFERDMYNKKCLYLENKVTEEEKRNRQLISIIKEIDNKFNTILKKTK